MKRTAYFILILFLCKTAYSQAIVDTTLIGKPVLDISVEGNRVTKTPVILRELKQTTGTLLDPKLVEEDHKRVLNLFLFHRVLLATEPYKHGARIKIIVTEKWYVFPFPVFFISDRDWNKLSYGAGITHNNFRGQVENLLFAFWLGYNPGITISYHNPWIGGKRNMITGFSAFSSRIPSKHYGAEVIEKHKGVSWNLGKKFGYHTFVNSYLSYKEIDFALPSPENLTPENINEKIPSIGLSLLFDYRDLHEYPSRGWYARFAGMKAGITGKEPKYSKFEWDIRGYVPVGRNITFAAKQKTMFSGGNVPFYDRVYLGYTDRIRGHFSKVHQGENKMLFSAGLRFPIIPVRYYNLAENPYLQDLKFGVSIGFFMDSGMTWFGKHDFNLNRILTGMGMGLHFHLPYINLARFEIAFNEKFEHEFIFDLFIDI